jgi:hypothetical protein
VNASDGLIHWWYATVNDGAWLTLHYHHFRSPDDPPPETDEPMNCFVCLTADLGTAHKNYPSLITRKAKG